MREISGVDTQRFNRTYDRVGHVFQDRYKVFLVQNETYLLELARYVQPKKVPGSISFAVSKKNA
jgi:putative transposase